MNKEPNGILKIDLCRYQNKAVLHQDHCIQRDMSSSRRCQKTMLKLQPMLITLSKGETIQWKSTESGLLRRGMGACQAAKYAEAGLYLTCRFGFHTAGKTEVDFRTGVHQLSKHLSLFTKKGKHLAILCSDKFSCP